MRRLPHFYVIPHIGTGWTVLQRNKSGPPDLVIGQFPTRKEARLTAARLNDRPRYSDALVAGLQPRRL